MYYVVLNTGLCCDFIDLAVVWIQILPHKHLFCNLVNFFNSQSIFRILTLKNIVCYDLQCQGPSSTGRTPQTFVSLMYIIIWSPAGKQSHGLSRQSGLPSLYAAMLLSDFPHLALTPLQSLFRSSLPLRFWLFCHRTRLLAASSECGWQ